MKWYFVTKKIDGKAYRYRQRTYRQSGKVRSQSQYVGPLNDVETTAQPNVNASTKSENNKPDIAGEIEALKAAVADGSFVPDKVKIAWKQKPLWPNEKQVSFGNDNSLITHDGISITAMRGEYARATKCLKRFGLDERKFASVKVLEGKKAGWKRHKGNYQVTHSNDRKVLGEIASSVIIA